LFGKQINFREAKNFLIDMLDGKTFTLKEDTDNYLEIEVTEKKRCIIFKVYFNKKLTVDITDSYFLLRVPKTTFKKIEKYKEFIVESVNKI
jgi:hypothetical protein